MPLFQLESNWTRFAKEGCRSRLWRVKVAIPPKKRQKKIIIRKIKMKINTTRTEPGSLTVKHNAEDFPEPSCLWLLRVASLGRVQLDIPASPV